MDSELNGCLFVMMLMPLLVGGSAPAMCVRTLETNFISAFMLLYLLVTGFHCKLKGLNPPS